MFSINSLVPACRASGASVERAIEMGDHALARHRKQRVGLAGADDDPGPSSPAQRTNFARRSERIGAHLVGGGGDIHVDIGHVDGHQPQPPLAEIAKLAQL